MDIPSIGCKQDQVYIYLNIYTWILCAMSQRNGYACPNLIVILLLLSFEWRIDAILAGIIAPSKVD